MNHKRKRPKHQRAGCLCCKPHKDERVAQRPCAGAADYHVEIQPQVRGKRRKNRKRWCRGVVGVEHKPRWVDRRASKMWLSYECATCDKVLDICGPGLFGTDRGQRYQALLAEHRFPPTYRHPYLQREVAF